MPSTTASAAQNYSGLAERKQVKVSTAANSLMINEETMQSAQGPEQSPSEGTREKETWWNSSLRKHKA